MQHFIFKVGDLILDNNYTPIIFRDGEGSPKSLSLYAPATFTADYSLYWPVDQATDGQILTGDHTGQLSWSSALTSSLTQDYIFLGNGSNIATAVPMTGDVSITYSGGNGVTSINGGLSNHLIWNETPSGTIGGGNTAFTIAHNPAGTGADLMLFLNGLLQVRGGSNDYTISGTNITFNTAPESGSVLLATYQY